MKVFYIGGEFLGCYYVRCFLPLMANGWRGSHTGLTHKSLKSPNLAMREMMESDVIVFHRANKPEHHKIGMLLKAEGKKIVFDNDDTAQLDKTNIFYNLDEKGYEENKEHLNNIMYSFIFNSDLVTVSTEVLAQEYREFLKQYNKDIPVVVLPNYVNPKDWDKPKRNEGDKVRIGIVGSTAYYEDLEGIKDVIKKLDETNNVQLVLFGLWDNKKRKMNPKIEEVHKQEFEFWDSIKNKEHVGWVQMNAYFSQLNDLKLDLMVIPRRENHLNKCKSNIKFLEASMCEIPVIAQSFPDGPYEELTPDIGVLVKDNWEEAIMDLVNDKDKRRQIGKNAREYVLKNYNIYDNAHKWEDNYKLILNK